MKTPENLYFTESDEWLRPESDGTVTIGITHYAQSELGEIVYLELPQVGDSLDESDAFGVAESVKAVGELHCPFAGTVVAINLEAVETPGMVNESPYEGGWLLQIEPPGPLDFTTLMNAEKYAAYRG